MEPIPPLTGSSFLLIDRPRPLLCTVTEVFYREKDGETVANHFTVQTAAPDEEGAYHIRRSVKRDHGILLPPLLMRVDIEWIPFIDRFAWRKEILPYARLADQQIQRLDDPDSALGGDRAHVWGMTQPFSLFPGETFQARATAIACTYWKTTHRRPAITVCFSSFVGQTRDDEFAIRLTGVDALQFHEQGYL